INEILKTKIACPSLKKLSLVGSSVQMSGSWQKRLAIKFPSLVRVDVTLGSTVRKSPGLFDPITFVTCVKARIHYPCGHILSEASRINCVAPCALCKGEIVDLYEAQGHITRFEKNPNKTWKSTVVDYKRKPLVEGQIYFHPNCQQFFNEETLKELYHEAAIEQILKADDACVCCLQQNAKVAIKGLFKAYPTLTEKNESEKSQQLTLFADPCYIDVTAS
ncbi:MAG: hypothetical protein JSR46_08805, partial [Verrucomicrobia bacterium]|nr:hypothetical protein [Verrucomicrobiota bacterium]